MRAGDSAETIPRVCFVPCERGAWGRSAQVFKERAAEANHLVFADDERAALAASLEVLPQHHQELFADLQRTDEQMEDDLIHAGGGETDLAEPEATKLAGAEEVGFLVDKRIETILTGSLLTAAVQTHHRVIAAMTRNLPMPAPPADDPDAAPGAAAHAAAAAATGAVAREALPGREEWESHGWGARDSERIGEFVEAYTVAGDLLRTLGRGSEGSAESGTGHGVEAGTLPLSVDAVTGSAHVFRLALESRRLAAPALRSHPAGNSASGYRARNVGAKATATETEYIDLNAAGRHVGEMTLLRLPVQDTRARLHTLLKEWPEHPMLEQLELICSRLLALPATAPLKQGLTGLELLLNRAQLWEDNAAKHVSLSAELEACAKVATRWRRFEMQSWPHLLALLARRHAHRAYRAWFALYSLLGSHWAMGATSATTPAAMEEGADGAGAEGKTEPEPSGVPADGTAGEEYLEYAEGLQDFMQGCNIGEYETRLGMLWQLYGHVQVQLAVKLPWSAAGTGEEEATAPTDDVGRSAAAVQLRQLARILYNSYRYYAQFCLVVAQKREALRAPLAQKLADHVRLAKWEDQSYFALKTSSETNERTLRRLCGQYAQALAHPVTDCLRTHAQSMGFNELASLAGVNQLDNGDGNAKPALKEGEPGPVPAGGKLASGGKDGSISRPPHPGASAAAQEELDEEAAAAKAKQAERQAKQAAKQAALEAETAKAEAEAARCLQEALELEREERAWWAEVRQWAATAATDASTELGSRGAVQVPEPIRPALPFGLGLAELAPRVARMVEAGVVGVAAREARLRGPQRLEMVVEAVVARSTSLRLNPKANKAQKKKALTDLTRALHRMGVSAKKSAVPLAERGALAAFLEPPLDPPAAFSTSASPFSTMSEGTAGLVVGARGSAVGDDAAADMATPLRSAPMLGGRVGSAAVEAWRKADAYYLKSLARLQAMRDLLADFHRDLSGAEVLRAAAMCEHLSYLQRRMRRRLKDLCDEYTMTELTARHLGSLAPAESTATLQFLPADTDADTEAAEVGLPPQQRSRAALWAQKAALDRAARIAEELRMLLCAVMDAEGKPGAAKYEEAAKCLAGALPRIQHCQAALNTHVLVPPMASAADAEGAAPVPRVVTGAMVRLMQRNTATLREIEAGMQQVAAPAGVTPQTNGEVGADGSGAVTEVAAVAALLRHAEVAEERNVPAGWEALQEALHAAGAQQPLDWSWQVQGGAANDAGAQEVFREQYEGTVTQLLLWAQNLHKHTALAEKTQAERERAAAAHRIKEQGQQAKSGGAMEVEGEHAEKPEETPKAVQEEGEEDEEDEEDDWGSIKDWLAELEGGLGVVAFTKARRGADRLLDAAVALAEAGSTSAGCADVAAAAVGLARQLEAPLQVAGAAFERLMVDYVQLAKSLCKLTSVLMSLYGGLFQEGFCKQGEEGEGQSGEGQGKLEDDLDGTGMAQGEGKKDVSDEMENEDQLMGTKEEEKPDKGPDASEQKQPGVEMRQDFEGELQDVSEDDEENNDDQEQVQAQAFSASGDAEIPPIEANLCGRIGDRHDGA
ncbi:hypothetical protein CYMTET_25433 [Cymbomonas tetramitiformis]|uniref:Uncharacterized protein n=1 Tax=Cymbomonas tetramitiformis TaxID=36881 RepID=A0AAE0FU68_9CHLO|nr:hypothetical protein CYMTET_25433 [Cymbomonas tetramitiformis]